jgi:large subunit ribosomal protein L18
MKLSRRDRIKKGIRKRLSGSTARPRLSVYRSNKGIYAQIIDDVTGKPLYLLHLCQKSLQQMVQSLTNQ